MVLLSRAEEIVLLAVSKLEDNAYGVTIRERIHKDINRYWSFGVIYRTLNIMKKKDFVEKIQSDPFAARGGRSRYYYKLTPEGNPPHGRAVRKVYYCGPPGVGSFAEGAVELYFQVSEK